MLGDIKYIVASEDVKIITLLTRIHDVFYQFQDIALNHPDKEKLDSLFIKGLNLYLKDLLDTYTNLQKALIHSYLAQRVSHIPFPDDHLYNKNREPISLKKIPLYLIYNEIVTLTNLIHYYTSLEYFTVIPFFQLSEAISHMAPDTDGIILVSSGCLQDPALDIRNIRDHSNYMPVLVMEESPENNDCFIRMGYSGVIREECPSDVLIEKFLNGLSVISANHKNNSHDSYTF